MTNYKQSSMTDIAFDLITNANGPIAFTELWNVICEQKELDEEKQEKLISQFYTNLTLDGRIINVGENKWDLRERHEFKEVHPDMSDYYADEDEEEYEEEVDDSTEEDDYN